MISEVPLVPRNEIDESEAAAELVKADGNISKAAKRLGVDSASLRVFVDCSPRLRAVIDETFESAVDDAIGVLFEGLHDEGSFLNRFYAAKEFLRTEAGRRRGFGREHVGASLELKNTESGAKVITLKWLSPPDEAPLSTPPSQVENAP